MGYYSDIDNYMLNTLQEHDDFYSLLYANGGIHPIEIKKSIERLYNTKQITQTKYNSLIETMQYPRDTRSTQSCTDLPIPHILDYDWRFSTDTLKILINKLTNELLNSQKKTIVYLGTPSLFLASIPYLSKNHNLVLIDVNANKHAQHICSDDLDNIALISIDINTEFSRIPPTRADYIIMDPPWYYDHYLLFFNRAAFISHTSTIIWCVMPPHFTRPSAAEEYLKILNYISVQYGFTQLAYYKSIIRYNTPEYEYNVLNANGIFSIPATWRVGDLLVLSASVEKMPLLMPSIKEIIWEEISYGTVRVKYRVPSSNIKSYAISLIHLYPDDIFPAVSKSYGNRNSIDLWTSGNRVLQCTNLPLLQFILKNLYSNNFSELLSATNNPMPSSQELSCLMAITHELRRLIAIEQNTCIK